MSVCNVKVAHIRHKHNNLKEWVEDDANEYVGRGGIIFIDGARYPPQDSIWANPFKVGQHGDRDNVVQVYKRYIKMKLEKDPELVKKLLALDGKNLGCWCHPEKCHADVLLKLIKKYRKKEKLRKKLEEKEFIYKLEEK